MAGSVLPVAGSVAGSLAPVFGSVAGSLLTGSCAAVSVSAAVANPVVSDVSASSLSSPGRMDMSRMLFIMIHSET